MIEVPVRWSNDSETHVRLLRSSVRMALDLVFVAAVAHGRGGDSSTASVRPAGLARDEETLA